MPLSPTQRRNKLYKLNEGSRVRVPQGIGKFCYMHNKTQSVVELDEKYDDDRTGLSVSHIFAHIDEVEIIEA